MTVIAIDQSYSRLGLAVARDGDIVECRSYRLNHIKGNKAKRKFVRKLVKEKVYEYNPNMIVVERVRLFASGFVSRSSILGLYALVITIVDSVDVPVYSIDTRSWKSRILGKASATKDDAVKFVLSKGINVEDHDAADAACMALYCYTDNPLLRKESN